MIFAAGPETGSGTYQEASLGGILGEERTQEKKK